MPAGAAAAAASSHRSNRGRDPFDHIPDSFKDRSLPPLLSLKLPRRRRLFVPIPSPLKSLNAFGSGAQESTKSESDRARSRASPFCEDDRECHMQVRPPTIGALAPLVSNSASLRTLKARRPIPKDGGGAAVEGTVPRP